MYGEMASGTGLDFSLLAWLLLTIPYDGEVSPRRMVFLGEERHFYEFSSQRTDPDLSDPSDQRQG